MLGLYWLTERHSRGHLYYTLLLLRDLQTKFNPRRRIYVCAEDDEVKSSSLPHHLAPGSDQPEQVSNDEWPFAPETVKERRNPGLKKTSLFSLLGGCVTHLYWMPIKLVVQ